MLYTNQNTISMATNAWPINYLLRVRPYHWGRRNHVRAGYLTSSWPRK
jgi:hypothetical protein